MLYAESVLKKSNTTLVGPSPAPGSWMHRLRRSMPSCKTRNSATLVGGVVGAFHVFLCFFHADFWHSALQKKLVLHRAHVFVVLVLQTSNLRVGFFSTSSTSTSSALSYFMFLMNVQALLSVPKIDESTNFLGRCFRRRVGKGVEGMSLAVFVPFTHQLVIVLIDELVTVCPRS